MKGCDNCKDENTNFKEYPCNSCKWGNDDSLKLLWTPKEEGTK